MDMRKITVGDIPAIIWGEPSDRVFLFVHGKLSSKEAAAQLAELVRRRGYQTLSFDLPGHGERDRAERCDVWNGVRDLRAVSDYVFARWKEVSLYACSLGAYLSLNLLGDRPVQRCLFQSPIVDMEHLTGKMMEWFGITPERLEREKEIDTPVDLMTWDYYRYVLAHPTDRWPHPTFILYGGRDDLQSREVIGRFATENKAVLTVSENSAHAFMDEPDAEIVGRWIELSADAKI